MACGGERGLLRTFLKAQCGEHTASQLTFANRAALRGATSSSEVRRLTPANPTRWASQGANKIRTVTWHPASCYNQGKNNWKSKSGVTQMLWHDMEVQDAVVWFSSS